ncbi:hypothetical protein ACJX0J_018115, partial [Zea mays]
MSLCRSLSPNKRHIVINLHVNYDTLRELVRVIEAYISSKRPNVFGPLIRMELGLSIYNDNHSNRDPIVVLIFFCISESPLGPKYAAQGYDDTFSLLYISCAVT